MMTKLEQKLIELGYEKEIGISFRKIIKLNSLEFDIVLYFKNRKNIEHKLFIYDKECGGCVPIIKTQQDIDDLQQAFNEMQKDLEELKKYER